MTPTGAKRYQLLQHYADRIRALPECGQLQGNDCWMDEFVLFRDGPLKIVYAPFAYENPSARVVLIGVTPGKQQATLAFCEASGALKEGAPVQEVARRVRSRASFAGPMRVNLVTMLDGIGLAPFLGIGTCSELFADRGDLLHTTSAIRDAVFVNGKNYTGSSPPLLATRALRERVESDLAAELASVPSAVYVPLGKAVSEALSLLASEGVVPAESCLLGFPHPSPGNGHRTRQYGERRDQLQRQLRALAGT